MRNLKKALALVLALMMALSLMVTASASDYADDSAIEQDEAVSVMSALGVFNGMGDGTFAPDGTLTRAQAAKIITYMLLGQEVADSLPNTGSQFADCRDGQWYVGSVNYLTDLGIVAGRNETTFDPKGNVNGYEFAKMLLGALGYNSKYEQFEGSSSWSINVATAARRAGLGADLPISAISSVALTREQAAKLAFNTLTATMVYYEGGVTVGEVTVNPTRKDVYNDKANHYDKTATGTDKDELMQFCEQYFPGLTYNAYSEPDDFGHTPDGRWMNGKTPAYTNLADPTVTLTEAVNEAGLKKLLPKNVTSDSVVVTNNGTAASAASKSLDDIAKLTGNGKKVEIYVSGSAITDVIVTTYTVETVDNVTEKNGTTTYKFSTSGTKANKEGQTQFVLEGDIDKGDVVTTVLAGGKLYVYPTTKFTGNQTAKKGTTTVTIGGAQYTIGTGVTGLVDNFTNSKDEATYYVDMNGYLVMKVGAQAQQQEINYAIIVNAIYGASTPSLDSKTSYTVNVRALLDDGSLMDATLKLDQATGKENDDEDWTGDDVAKNDHICGNVKVGNATLSGGVSGLIGQMFGYYIDDGKMVLDKVDYSSSIVKNGTYGLVLPDDYTVATSAAGKDPQDGITALFNSKTVFVIYGEDANSKLVAQAHTGTTGLKVEGTKGALAIITANSTTQGTASVVFLNAKIAGDAPTEYVYIDVDTKENVLNGDKDVYAYTGIAPDGTSDTYYTKTKAELANSGLYLYDADKVLATALISTDPEATPAEGFKHVTIAETNDELIKVDGAWVKMTDDTQVVLAEGVEAIDGSNCFVVMKDGVVAVIFAYETPCQHTDRTLVPAVDASKVACNAKASKAYYVCDDCGAKFQAETGDTEATAEWIADGAQGTKHTATSPAEYIQGTGDHASEHAVKCANSGDEHAAGEWVACTDAGDGECVCGRTMGD